MEIAEYFERLNTGFNDAFTIASSARAKGFDPQKVVEIRPAQGIAARVEGIVGQEGLAEMINTRAKGRSRQELAFEMAKEICIGEKFKAKTVEERLTLAVQTGVAILTEGVVVASTEGIQKVQLHKGIDGADYIAVVYAGPIRGAGGTDAALSVALADYARTQLGIGPYKAQQTEVERCIEEIEIYHTRIARLQYYPNEQDIRHILTNCPVCVDGMPSERIEIAVHRNVKRLDAAGKEEMMSNRVRGGIGLVICEGIAQKAKSVMLHTKNAGLDWSWLNSVIKVDKPGAKGSEQQDKSSTVFLQDLVAGRPILAYPAMHGSFRLRYGRSRFSGIAAKGFSPATMIILGGFIAVGTQLRIEAPGKGCVAVPVDTIEGPFVKLKDGRALRINDAKTALELKDNVAKIIAVGDILITYGDFKKANAQLRPSSYVEEYWAEHLLAAGHTETTNPNLTFKEAFDLSMKTKVPMHPKYIYDYSDLLPQELMDLRSRICAAISETKIKYVFDLDRIELGKPTEGRDMIGALEKLCVPHQENGNHIILEGDELKSLVCSLGLTEGEIISISKEFSYDQGMGALEMVNLNSPFKIMKRSSRIGARIGRPEKAKERLMKPAPHILFPIGEHGGKERNVSKAYELSKKKFRNSGIEVEVARYRCNIGSEPVTTHYCARHASLATLEYICKSCGRRSDQGTCISCGGVATAWDRRNIDLISELDSASRNLGGVPAPKLMKGVKGLSSNTKSAEPLEKGILRASSGVFIFKDGTSRFDATDVPITHFYPREMNVSVEKLRSLGYTKDYKGNELERDDQLVEMFQQDVILNKNGAEYFMKVAGFMDNMLSRYYHMQPFYKLSKPQDLIGQFVITLSPHTSAGVLCRIVGFTEAFVGFAHPYIICARRRNCDGDEDTTMLLLDALINFSRSYLPSTVGGTMDAPLILTVNVDPTEVDSEVHATEVVEKYGLDFYQRAERKEYPAEAKVETIKNRLGTPGAFKNFEFTHLSTIDSITYAPKRSMYTALNTMSEKIDAQFRLTDMLECVDRSDCAKKLIMSHFIPDLIGNMHSFSRQEFRSILRRSHAVATPPQLMHVP